MPSRKPAVARCPSFGVWSLRSASDILRFGLVSDSWEVIALRSTHVTGSVFAKGFYLVCKHDGGNCSFHRYARTRFYVTPQDSARQLGGDHLVSSLPKS